MKKVIFLIVALLCIGVAVAAEDLCTDSDDGGGSDNDVDALETKGDVKYGITTKVDTCVTSPTGVSTSSSPYLLEYFCKDDQRDSDVYNCVDLGYTSCYAGRCNGSLSQAQIDQRNQASVQQEQAHCGNDIVEKDKGENCDPPGSICFGDSTAEYGSCQNDCKCKIAEAAKKNIKEQPAVCGDGVKHPDEECEEDDHCESGYVCSSCSCVKELTPEEIEALKKSASDKDGDEKKEVVPEEVIPEIPDDGLKNFSDDPSIKATSGIANFFKKVFGWIGALFS